MNNNIIAYYQVITEYYKIYLDKKRIGTIQKLKNGKYQYWPGGLKKFAADEFDSFKECYKSLF